MRFPRLRFSLRTLIVLVLMITIAASWHGRRLLRHRERSAAKLSLAEFGIHLEERASLEALLKESPFGPEDTRFFEVWDSYWFGAESTSKYSVALIRSHEFLRPTANDPLSSSDIQLLLQKFPECHAYCVDIHYASYTYARSTPHFDEDQRRRMSDLSRSLASMPNLKLLMTSSLPPLDDAWVEALPEETELRVVVSAQWNLTPRGLSELCRKARHFLFFQTFDASAFDEHTVAAMNHVFPSLAERRKGADDPNRDFPFHSEFIINADDPRSTSSNQLNPVLRELKIPYELRLSGSTTKFGDASSPIELKNYTGLEHLECVQISNLRVVGCPKLSLATFERCKGLRLDDCPELSYLTFSDRSGSESEEFVVENFPKLTSLSIECESARVANCTSLSRLQHNSVWQSPPTRRLTVRTCPSIEIIEYDGAEWDIDPLSKVELLRLTNPSTAVLRNLSALPNVRRVELKYYSYNDSFAKPAEFHYIPGDLAHLETALNLRDLSLELNHSGRFFERDAFQRDLASLSHVRVLRLNNPEKFSLVDPTKDGGVCHFPVDLEILITGYKEIGDGTVRKIIASRFPSLIYLEFDVIEAKFGRDKVREIENGVNAQTLSTVELAPYAIPLIIP